MLNPSLLLYHALFILCNGFIAEITSFSCHVYMTRGHNVGLTWISLPVTPLAHRLAFCNMFVIMKGIGLQYIRLRLLLKDLCSFG